MQPDVTFEVCSSAANMELAFHFIQESFDESGVTAPSSFRAQWERHFADKEIIIGKVNGELVSLCFFKIIGDTVKHSYAAVTPAFRREGICNAMRVFASTVWKERGALKHYSTVDSENEWRTKSILAKGAFLIGSKQASGKTWNVYERSL